VRFARRTRRRARNRAEVKRYEVIVTPEAEDGIVSAFGYIHERSPENAAKWLRGRYREIDTLETSPERCSVARENEYLEGTLRQLLFKSHRIIFRVEQAEKIVRILYVLQGRQKAIGEQDDDPAD
jgi:plasmid stabilization system protein ParE